MEQTPALFPRRVPTHIEAPANPDQACLAMALCALELADDAETLLGTLDTTPQIDPGQRALEALQHGAHATLHGQPPHPALLEDALAAGLHHDPRTPGIRHVTAALEARHPAIILTDREPLHPTTEPGPHTILATHQTPDTLTYHDPLEAQGPTTDDWETLHPALDHAHDAWILELAPPPRDDDA